MARYITVRLFQGAIVIFLISVATFVIMRLHAGRSGLSAFGEGQVRISEEQKEAIRAEWGLDRTLLHVQYLTWAAQHADRRLWRIDNSPGHARAPDDL